MFDCSLPSQDLVSSNKILYWLKLIEKVSQEAHVIIVANKYDNLKHHCSKLGILNLQMLNEKLLEINRGKKKIYFNIFIFVIYF